jgi:anti-sigma factor RsiW
MTLSCEMSLLVQADFDGELDAADAARVEQHRGQCAVCWQTYDDLRRTREALRAGGIRVVASPALVRRLRTQWEPRRPRRFALSAVLGAVAAAVAVVVAIRPDSSGLAEQAVGAHVRALQPGHLIDVASEDRHTVKPWFDGRLDFAPPVKDLAAEGFPLKGGRLDYLDHRPVAALVYERGRHPINLFIWPARDGLRGGTTVRDGYTVIAGEAHGMAVMAVSDLEADQLARFMALWREAP